MDLGRPLYDKRVETHGTSDTWLWSLMKLYIGEFVMLFCFICPWFVNLVRFVIIALFIQPHDTFLAEANMKNGLDDRYGGYQALCRWAAEMSSMALFALSYSPGATSLLGKAAPYLMFGLLRSVEAILYLSPSIGCFRFIKAAGDDKDQRIAEDKAKKAQ